MSKVESWGGAGVLVIEPEGVPIGGREVRDLVAEALGERAEMVAIPVGRLQPAFFDLRTGVAGDILQASANYRIRLAIVGDPQEPGRSSTAFAALVRESNGGSQHWFVASIDALRERLGGSGLKAAGSHEIPG